MRDKEILAFCREHSLYPLLPALSELQPAYEDHSIYDQFPPDLLHTLIGLLEYWVSMVITIIAKMQETTNPHCLSRLEQMLQDFPHKQTMPYRVRHFTNGLASIVPGTRLKNMDIDINKSVSKQH